MQPDRPEYSNELVHLPRALTQHRRGAQARQDVERDLAGVGPHARAVEDQGRRCVVVVGSGDVCVFLGSQARMEMFESRLSLSGSSFLAPLCRPNRLHQLQLVTISCSNLAPGRLAGDGSSVRCRQGGLQGGRVSDDHWAHTIDICLPHLPDRSTSSAQPDSIEATGEAPSCAEGVVAGWHYRSAAIIIIIEPGNSILLDKERAKQRHRQSKSKWHPDTAQSAVDK